jgi:hypothetical protein
MEDNPKDSQMRKTLILGLVLVSTLHLSSECRVDIHITHPTPTDIKLTITHDANCTLTIEESNTTLPTEHNQTTPLPIVLLAKTKLGIPYKGGATQLQTMKLLLYSHHECRSDYQREKNQPHRCKGGAFGYFSRGTQTFVLRRH